VKDKNFKAMRKVGVPGGLIAALFGRMVTSDPAANIDAPVHVRSFYRPRRRVETTTLPLSTISRGR